MATGDLAHSRTPMINLKDNALSFTFPEIAQEVRALFERQLQIILPELQRPEERAGLLAELASRWGFRQLSPTEQDRLRARANSLTAAEIEAAFVAANPGLAPEDLVVTCRDGLLREVRICLTRELAPRRCGADVERSACRAAGAIALPPP